MSVVLSLLNFILVTRESSFSPFFSTFLSFYSGCCSYRTWISARRLPAWANVRKRSASDTTGAKAREFFLSADAALKRRSSTSPPEACGTTVEEPGFSPCGAGERDAGEFAAEVGGVALAVLGVVQDGVDVVKDIPLGDGVLYRGVGRLEGQRHFWWVSLPREWPRLGWRGWCFTMGVRNSASLGLPWGGTTEVVLFPVLLRFRSGREHE